jgi:hypothetical protein
MARKTSGDSSLGVSGIIFRRIQDSFTTQGFAFKGPAAQAVSRATDSAILTRSQAG